MLVIWSYVQVAFALLLLTSSDATGQLGYRCPNKCSSHGTCMVDNVCACEPGWNTKLVPDCSLRQCSTAPAWAGKPWTVDTAHSAQECSNAGMCNRKTGICDCFPGYTGLACERMACPNDCGDHGQCMTLGQQYNQFNTAGDRSLQYTQWDSQKSAGCVCDPGYTGGRCEYRFCPKGADPIIPVTHIPTITITTHSSSGTLGGKMKFTFNGESFYFPAVVALWTPAQCKKKFESLPNIKRVVCTQGALDYSGGGTTYTVQIQAWPTNPWENNVYTHRGNPTIDSFHCDASLATNSLNNAITCVVADVTYSTPTSPHAVVVPQYEQCSNRGVCDMLTGTCTCFDNFSGSQCNIFSPNGVYRNMPDVMTITETNPQYSMTLLHLADSIRSNEKKWTSIIMEADMYLYDDLFEKTLQTGNTRLSREQLFRLNCGGDIVMNHGGIHVGINDTGSTGLNVYTSGMTVEGGVTVASGGMELNNGEVPLNFTSNVTVTGGLKTTHFVKVNYGGLSVGGGMTIFDGGLKVPYCGYVSGDVSVVFRPDIWCSVPLGVYVGAGGMRVSQGGMRVYDGVSVVGGLLMFEPVPGRSTWGATINTGGLTVTRGGMSVTDKGLTVARGLTIPDSGLMVTNGGMTINFQALEVAGGVTVTAGGLTVTQLQIYNGLSIAAGGLTVQAGGMGVMDGVTITDVGLRISASGMRSLNAIRVNDAGLYITTAGASILSGGISVTGGITVSSGGIGPSPYYMRHEVNQGLTIAGGLRFSRGYTSTGGGIYAAQYIDVVTGGVTVVNSGLVVTQGGMTVGLGGLMVTAGGATVSTKGLKVNDGVSVGTGGVRVAASGATILAGGVTVTQGAMQVSGGLQATNTDGNAINLLAGAIGITGGATIYERGLKLSEQVQVLNTGLMFDVPAAHVVGVMSQLNGGLVKVAGVGQVNSGGLTVTGGVTIQDAGLKVTSSSAGPYKDHVRASHYISKGLFSANRITVTKGLLIKDARTFPFTISSGLHVTGVVTLGTGIRTNGAVVVHTGGVQVKGAGKASIASAGSTVVGGAVFGRGPVNIMGIDSVLHSVMQNGLVTDSLTVRGGVLTVTRLALNTSYGWHAENYMNRKFLAINSGGLRVYDIGLNIYSYARPGVPYPGLGVTEGGLNIALGGLSVTQSAVFSGGQVSVFNQGLTAISMNIMGGLSVKAILRVNNGLVLDYYNQIHQGSGLTSMKYGPDDATLKIRDGLIITSGGLSVLDSGLTIATDQFVSSDNANGVTVVDGGSVLDYGLTMLGSVAAEDGAYAKVYNAGLFLASGSVTTEYMTCAGMVTLNTKGLVVTAGGITIAAGGMRTETIVVTAGSAQIKSDLSILAGTIFITSGTISVTSDRRLKENISYISMREGRDVVRKLRGVFFDWNPQHAHSRRLLEASQNIKRNTSFSTLPDRRVGFIAQELQSVLPDLVQDINITDTPDIEAAVHPEDPILGVVYSDVVPYVVMSLRDVDDRLSLEVSRQREQRHHNQQSNGTVTSVDLVTALTELELMLQTAEKNSEALRAEISAVTRYSLAI